MPPCRPQRRLPHGRAAATALACVITLVAALVAALLPAGGAQAAERTVSGGRLDWGIKSSFQRYITGPVAQGSWTLGGGAATVGESQFRFHSAKGSYDPDSGAFKAGFSGAVHFTGHRKQNGTPELDLTISNPTVRISGRSGILHADMRSKAKGSGAVSNRTQVPLASLNLSGVDMRGGGSPVALNSVPTTLTAEGAKAFAGYYTAGTELDPVSLSADVRAASAAKPSPSAPSSDASGKPSASSEPGKKAGDIADAAVDWGVRRTFREYVTGSIARGKWKLADGAQDGGALFRFPRGKGTYDTEKAELAAEFGGSVRFTGKDLDLTLRELTVRVKDGTGTLSAEGEPLVTFDAPLKPEDGLVAVEEAPATLTEQGAEVFGGMYQKGTEMDPVSLAVALDDQAELPALPDLGSDGSATPDESAKSAKSAAPKTATEPTSSSSTSPALPISLAATFVAALAAAIWFVRKRRTAAPTDNSEESQPR